METLKSKQAFFDRWASFYDCPLTSIFYQSVHHQLLHYVSLPAAAKVLDLGCGTGRFLNRLAAHQGDVWGIGVDFSEQMLRQARRTNRYRSRLLFIQAEAESLRFSSEFFDAVFCCFSLLHYSNPSVVFQDVKRVLRPEGHFYWIDPHPMGQDPVERLAVTPDGITFYNAKTREQYAHQAGLHCLTHIELTFPTLLSIFLKPMVKSVSGRSAPGQTLEPE